MSWLHSGETWGLAISHTSKERIHYQLHTTFPPCSHIIVSYCIPCHYRFQGKLTANAPLLLLQICVTRVCATALSENNGTYVLNGFGEASLPIFYNVVIVVTLS